MSVTHSEAVLGAKSSRRFTEQHPQLAPFTVAVAIVFVSVVLALAFTGLPA
jgi:hypothetical protein